MTEQPPGLLPTGKHRHLMRATSTTPSNSPRRPQPDPSTPEQHAPNGDGLKALRPLRGRAPPEP